MDIGEGSGGAPDYVLVGHATRDVFGPVSRPGGTVYYAGATAAHLGRRVGIVTAGDVPLINERALCEAETALVPSRTTTTYQFSDGPEGRSLRLLEMAAAIHSEAVPAAWRQADIVHLAPIADELSDDLLDAFASARLVVGTGQGWMRAFDTDGRVQPAPERILRLPLERFNALVVSVEDLRGDGSLAWRIGERVRVLVVTHGSEGCTVHHLGLADELPALPAASVDTTGAGDVFAAAFFVRLSETEDALASARFASAAAAIAIEGDGAACIPNRGAVLARLRGDGACIE